MFELFIALFGGLYYGCKYSSEKAKASAFDARRNARAATREDIKLRYVASYEAEQKAKDFLSSGEHYDEICSWFAEDFQYAIGNDWKEKLRMPKKYLPLVCVYGKRSYPWSMPSAHIMWAYHLLLAKYGKIDHGVPSYGYPVGGIDDKDMTIKFAECIERRLNNAGARDIRLAFELDEMSGIKRLPGDVCGGNIKIESLCVFPSYRLW